MFSSIKKYIALCGLLLISSFIHAGGQIETFIDINDNNALYVCQDNMSWVKVEDNVTSCCMNREGDGIAFISTAQGPQNLYVVTDFFTGEYTSALSSSSFQHLTNVRLNWYYMGDGGMLFTITHFVDRDRLHASGNLGALYCLENFHTGDSKNIYSCDTAWEFLDAPLLCEEDEAIFTTVGWHEWHDRYLYYITSVYPESCSVQEILELYFSDTMVSDQGKLYIQQWRSNLRPDVSLYKTEGLAQ